VLRGGDISQAGGPGLAVATTLARSGDNGHAAAMEKRTKSKCVSRTEVAVALVALVLFGGVFMLGAALRRLIE
jgi:hypothetical protein